MSNYRNAFATGIYPQERRTPDRRYDININKSSTDTIPANLIVDSSRRDRSIYENPGQYTFDLINPYRDVISVELTQANIPKSFYSISSDNNRITFTFDNTEGGGERNGITWTATLPTGDYTTFAALATDFAAALNAAEDNGTAIGYTQDENAKFEVAYSTTTGKFTVTAPTRTPDNGDDLTYTNVVFVAGQPNNADTIIGLGATNEDSDGGGDANNILTFSNCAILHPYRYLVLEIRGMERCDGNSSTLMNSFCIIPLDTASNNFGLLKDGDTINNDTYVHHFTEPLPKLNRMELTIRKPDGNICDFNGRDHFLVFEICSLSRPHKYT